MNLDRQQISTALQIYGKSATWADDFETLALQLGISIEKAAQKVIQKPSPEGTRQVVQLNNKPLSSVVPEYYNVGNEGLSPLARPLKKRKFHYSVFNQVRNQRHNGGDYSKLKKMFRKHAMRRHMHLNRKYLDERRFTRFATSEVDDPYMMRRARYEDSPRRSQSKRVESPKNKSPQFSKLSPINSTRNEANQKDSGDYFHKSKE